MLLPEGGEGKGISQVIEKNFHLARKVLAGLKVFEKSSIDSNYVT